jgi:hypothetical protein
LDRQIGRNAYEGALSPSRPKERKPDRNSEEALMYASQTTAPEIFLDGDDEADRKTVEWLRKEVERRAKEQSSSVPA